MRPLRLEVKGFTAFRDAQTVDFEGLDVFAISGPTGSGKTSILDAITYALFGTIERVGRQAAQFVSQGQVRMAVCFEFAVDGDRLRVTRTTPAKGATKILLERWDGDGWRPDGEGADRVREADAKIRRAVGLDYDAFTRTVLLPQGRFAEFLVGDARERRSILTELLGLELFERLGKRAGELRRDAEAEARAKTTVLETEYAGVTPDSVGEAEAVAKEAASRDQAFAAAEANVREVAERWADRTRALRELRMCAHDLREAASTASDAAEALEELAERSSAAEATAAERHKAVTLAERSAARSTAARSKAEESWGRTVELVGLRAKAERLLDAGAARDEARRELDAVRRELPRLEKDAAASADRLRVATADAEAAIEALGAAEGALEDARHADLVAAVRAGVRRGDACPVCGATVATLPRSTRRGQPLEKAKAALEKARAGAAEVQAVLQAAERASAEAAAATSAAHRDLARCERTLAKAEKDVAALEREVVSAVGARRTADPVALLDERIERLDSLERDERDAEAALAAARDAEVLAVRERDGLAAEVAAARGRLEAIAVSGLLDRARSIGGDGLAVPSPPAVRGREAASLATAAAAVSAALEDVAEQLEDLTARAGEAETEAVREAAAHLEGLMDLRPGSLSDLVDALSQARTKATRAAATAEDRAARLREQLANAASIVEQVAEHRERADVFDALAKELRADRLIAFLQVEALQMLAAAGSERLATLSSGRYRLEFEQDEFSVVDTWNGEERRSARTLSGGETFLASLALALALSEQVRALAVTERARLDSLFLDEGFGTLDPETLEIVVDAIEQLGGDGRMVGVITHVQELAIRLPARVEVEKSPRGSTLRLVS